MSHITRRRGLSLVLAPALAIVLMVPSPGTALLGTTLLTAPATTDVIVQLWNGSDTTVATAVGSLGGRLTRRLPVVVGFSATVPTAAIGTIAALPGVRAITPDALVLPQDVGSDGLQASVYRQVVTADVAQAAGQRGAGTTVALIDTGIANVPDVAGRIRTVTDPATGRAASCVNFSDERGCADSYGHGTFIAGLIAGNGASSNGAHVGVAPGADLIALKLSGRSGESNVSDVLAAIGWVIDNRDAHGIDVVNLSLRVDSTLSYRIDPLNLAVQRAWAAGIVVVVSAGNLGPAPGTIAKPADDPWVIAVGSTDDRGTVPQADDTVGDFSSRGPTRDGVAKPDVVVPGRSLVSLRSPGSEADLRFPAFLDANYRRGSGTSFSAGLVTGAAAVLIGANPALTPDEVKNALLTTARPLAAGDLMSSGAGTLDLAAALAAPRASANQHLFHPLFAPTAPGQASDFSGSAWLSPSWITPSWQGSNWQGSNWQGSNWQGSNWQGSNWQGSNWQGSNWQGSNWQGSNWQGSNWQ